jgi:hypothetical protein
MPKNKNLKRRGFIQIILLVVGALVLLKYVYNMDIVGYLTQGRPKELLDQFYSLAARGWTKYDSTAIEIWDYLTNFAKNLAARFR